PPASARQPGKHNHGLNLLANPIRQMAPGASQPRNKAAKPYPGRGLVRVCLLTGRGGTQVAASQSIRKHLAVIAIPRALNSLARVILPLELEEFDDLRISGEDLLARGVAVIGQEVAAAHGDRPTEERAEVAAGLGDSFRRVVDVQVAEHADLPLL